jgi:hypothetical protein
MWFLRAALLHAIEERIGVSDVTQASLPFHRTRLSMQFCAEASPPHPAALYGGFQMPHHVEQREKGVPAAQRHLAWLGPICYTAVSISCIAIAPFWRVDPNQLKLGIIAMPAK